MSSRMIPRLSASAVLLSVAAMTACSSAPPATEAGAEPAPPTTSAVMTAKSDVLTREQIVRINASRMTDLFEGRFAGVQVRPYGGRTTLFIRGFPDPLVVVDNVPQASSQELWLLDPNDIERIEILKDSGSVLYGARGGHGVVEITTRRR